MLPKLVTDLIDWYLWKGQMWDIHREYYRDYTICESDMSMRVLVSRHNLGYNHRYLTTIYSYIYGRNSNYHVATIPSKYYYSSGLNNSNGYNNN